MSLISKRSCRVSVLKKCLLFLLFSFIIFLRRPDMFLNSQPWAEDGIIFIQQALEKGLNSLFISYAGYLHLGPRLITLISIFISNLFNDGIELVPLLMNIFTVFISASTVYFLCTSHFNWLSSLRNRIMVSIFIISMPGASEVFGSATNINWWIGIFQFLFVLYVFKKRSLPSIFITVLFLLSGFSGPMIVVSLFFLILMIGIDIFKNKKYQRELILVSMLTAIVSLLQVIITLTTRITSNDSGVTIHNFLVYFPKTVLVGVFARLVFPFFQSQVQFLQLSTSAIIGLIVLILVIKMCLHNKLIMFLSISYVFMLLFITFAGSVSFFNLYSDPFQDNAGRYIFVPLAIMIILIFSNIDYVTKGINRYLSVCLTFLYLIVIIVNFSIDPYVDMKWKDQVSIYSKDSGNRCVININPPGWKMTLPCE